MSNERKPLWPWIVALLIGLPVLYVLSSGPLKTVAFQRKTKIAYFSLYERVPIVVTDRGKWWPKVYAPLVWASEQRGCPIESYWELFPIRE